MPIRKRTSWGFWNSPYFYSKLRKLWEFKALWRFFLGHPVVLSFILINSLVFHLLIVNFLFRSLSSDNTCWHRQLFVTTKKLVVTMNSKWPGGKFCLVWMCPNLGNKLTPLLYCFKTSKKWGRSCRRDGKGCFHLHQGGAFCWGSWSYRCWHHGVVFGTHLLLRISRKM